jgi:hypothetical protein
MSKFHGSLPALQSPRPAQVSVGLSGLRYLGATGPFLPRPAGRPRHRALTVAFRTRGD